jgi:putative addiction module killer protein
MKYIIKTYKTANGKIPFDKWLNDLDTQIRQRIVLKVQRLSLGNFGNCRSICEGIFELKLDFGPGYRIYFCLIKQNIILILFAGTKRTQSKDIQKAKNFLHDFKKILISKGKNE